MDQNLIIQKDFEDNLAKKLANLAEEMVNQVAEKSKSFDVEAPNIYEFPSTDFLRIIEYIEYLLAYRQAFFSFDTHVSFHTGDQEKFIKELSEMVSVISSVDPFLANMNDTDFLYNAGYLINRECVELGNFIRINDLWGDNPEYEKYRNLYRRLYSILSGDGTRISDLTRSSGFDIRITPYHTNLDIACKEISKALHTLEPELNKRGFFFDSKVYYILDKGPSHEQAHQEAYINYNPKASEGRRSLLNKGNSRLGEWVNYSIDLQIRRQGNTILTGMTVGMPPMSSLEESLFVYLAPEEPSLGDALYSAKEIFSNLPSDSVLYQEVLDFISEACIELNIFDSSDNVKEVLINGMRGTYNDDFIKQRLIRNLKTLGDLFVNQLVQIIRNNKKDYIGK